MRHYVLILGVVALVATGCSSSTPTSAPTSTPPTSGITAPSSAAPAGTITLSGDLDGTATASLCTSGVASVQVKIDGDDSTYVGSISARSFGFVGPDAADYSLKKGAVLPTASADGTSFSVGGATLVDLVSGKTVTATGTVTCP
ncbi:MAG: hypothetical protein ACJ72E_00570 [Marmoricola sp.]